MESDAPTGVRVLPPVETLRLAVDPNPPVPARGAAVPGTGAPPERWHRFLSAARPGDYRRAFYILAAVLLGLFLLVALHGPVLQIYYGHDDLGFLNSAWKIRHGILPHADYHSALGALSPSVLAAGMWLLGPTAAVLPFCSATLAVLFGLLAWTVASRRLPAPLAGFFAFTQTLVAITPHLIRYGPYGTTYASYYNGQGYALLSTFMLLMFLPRTGSAADREQGLRVDGRLAGAIAGALLFLKISYFMAAVGLGGVASIFGRRWSRGLGWNALAAFGVAAAACLPLIRFDVPAMLRDLHMAAASRGADPNALFTPGHFLSFLPEAWVEVSLLAMTQALLTPPWIFRRNSPGHDPAAGDPTPSWAEFAGLTGASMFICMTNAASGTLSETPLLTSWLFVLLGCALREGIGGSRMSDAAGNVARSLRLMGGLSCVLWVYTFGNGLASLGWACSPWPTQWQQQVLRAAPRIRSASLEDLRIFGAGGELPQPLTYTEKINDGLVLLRKLGGPHRVEAFDFVNPFPFALQWPAVRGGIWCWHNGYSFSERAHPTAEEAFGDADVVMVPKYPGEVGSFPLMLHLYGDYLNANFRLVDQSSQWRVLVRK